MDNLLVVVGFVLSIIGVIGCILPGIPGPPLNLVALILIKIAYPDQVSWLVLILFGFLTLAVTILDYAIPLMGGNLFKASKSGIVGSTIGMIIGIFFFAPFGMFVGLTLGALIGELVSGKSKFQAAKAGAGIFILSIAVIILKLGISLTMSFYFLYKLAVVSNFQFKLF
jgi:hypothetical protein